MLLVMPLPVQLLPKPAPPRPERILSLTIASGCPTIVDHQRVIGDVELAPVPIVKLVSKLVRTARKAT